MTHSADNIQLIKSAARFSIFIGLFIASIKIYGWLHTNSAAIMASLVDSCFDVSSSIINVIAIRYAFMPPDDNHRFGHEKIQDVAVFAQSSFFLCSGLFAMFASVKNLVAHEIMHAHTEGITIILISIVANAILITYQTIVIRKTKSKIIEADKLHYFVDFLTNGAVVVSIVLSQYFWYIDGIFAIAIAGYIIASASKLLRSAFRNLIDEEFSKHDKEKILAILGEYHEIRGVHELKTRHAGDKRFIQFHLELDPEMTLLNAHQISDRIMAHLEREFGYCEVLIHQDPAGYEANVLFKEM